MRVTNFANRSAVALRMVTRLLFHGKYNTGAGWGGTVSRVAEGTWCSAAALPTRGEIRSSCCLSRGRRWRAASVRALLGKLAPVGETEARPCPNPGELMQSRDFYCASVLEGREGRKSVCLPFFAWLALEILAQLPCGVAIGQPGSAGGGKGVWRPSRTWGIVPRAPQPLVHLTPSLPSQSVCPARCSLRAILSGL